MSSKSANDKKMAALDRVFGRLSSMSPVEFQAKLSSYMGSEVADLLYCSGFLEANRSEANAYQLSEDALALEPYASASTTTITLVTVAAEIRVTSSVPLPCEVTPIPFMSSFKFVEVQNQNSHDEIVAVVSSGPVGGTWAA